MFSAGTKQVVLITGPLGAGKAGLLEMLTQLGYVTLDVDGTIRRLTSPGSAGHAQIVASFGDQALDANGQINWLGLLSAARTDTWAGHDLLGIIRPVLRDAIEAEIRRSADDVVFIAATDPKAYGLREFADQCWALAAPPQLRI